jgi:6-phosphofructokinase 1
MAKSVGILTGGGDCPGLNAVIRAVVRRADAAGWDVVAVREGWRGLVEPVFEDLGAQQVSGILPGGGTIIGTSRTNPFKLEGGVERVLQNFSDRGLDALVAIGGEDTLGVAARLHAEHQLPVVGVPKTIDNDLSGTDYTFGFRHRGLHRDGGQRMPTRPPSRTTASWSSRMGRHTGWIAVMSGTAGGADVIPCLRSRSTSRRSQRTSGRARARQELSIVVRRGCEPGLADAGSRTSSGT